MDKKLIDAINSLIIKFEFVMFECKKGETYFMPDHYQNLDYNKSKRIKVGKGVIGNDQFYYLTNEIR